MPVFDDQGNVTMRETLDLGLTIDERTGGRVLLRQNRPPAHSTCSSIPELLEQARQRGGRLLMSEAITAKTPWAGQSMGDVPAHLDYFPRLHVRGCGGALHGRIPQSQLPLTSWARSTTYKKMVAGDRDAAPRALSTIGVREGDKRHHRHAQLPAGHLPVLRRQSRRRHRQHGASPVQPRRRLSSIINESESVTVVTLDQFYHKFEAIRQNT